MSEPEPSAPVEALVCQLYGLGAVKREISRHALAELGSQGFTALAAIQGHGPLRVSEVAHELGVDLSVASRQVAALAHQGHVERGPDDRDRRAQLVAATPAGVRVLEDSHRRMVAVFTRVLAGWSDDDIAALTGGLQRLRDDFTRLQTPTAPTSTTTKPA
jgi:DNA-binding MarR family transcriptional regulator